MTDCTTDPMSTNEAVPNSLDDRYGSTSDAVQSPDAATSDKCNDEEDDASSFVSETSTIAYTQEPYTTFQLKAADLSKELFPGHASEDITLERMKGGSFNRIIGVALAKHQPKLSWYSMAKIRTMLSARVRGKFFKAPSSKQYILRIPREDVHDLCDQAVTLAYLERALPYPVPKVVSYDSSSNNALGRVYMVQKRLAGQPLSQLWYSLSLEQRRSAARYIAEIVRDLHQVKNTCAGIISSRNTAHGLAVGPIKLEPVPVPGFINPTNISKNAHLAQPLSTQDFLLSLISRQRIAAQMNDMPPFDHIWTGFIAMINKLYSQDLLPDTDMFHLYHPDLQSRNLLFTTPTPTTVCLTGILDWDNAMFVPSFMSTRSPFFRWTGEGADEDEEKDALIEPDNPEMREYEQIFANVVGEEFCKSAYQLELVFLRRMWRFLVNGIRSGIDQLSAEELLQDWESVHPVFTVGE